MRDYDIIEADEALDIVLKHALPLTPRPVTLLEALDLVLAQDVIAPEDLPPFPCSAKDGFAVIAADTTNPRRLVGEQTAGNRPAGKHGIHCARRLSPPPRGRALYR